MNPSISGFGMAIRLGGGFRDRSKSPRHGVFCDA